MKIFKDIEQGSEEWFNIRNLKGTASKATAIKSCGAGIDTLARELVQEHLSSETKEQYNSEDMKRGTELEPLAREVYEMLNNVDVNQIGFVEYNDYIGCSPDGLVGDNGLVEIKCPSDKVYINDIIFDKKIPSNYYNQVQMQMLIMSREYCDLMFYNPNFTKSYVIHRILPDEETREKLLKGFAMLEDKIKYYLNLYQDSK